MGCLHGGLGATRQCGGGADPFSWWAPGGEENGAVKRFSFPKENTKRSAEVVFF